MEIAISVVVPTFQRPQLLISCLRHLCRQTLEREKYEVIIVSDGPDVLAKQIVAEYRTCSSLNIKFLSLPVKKGPAAARNLGWQNAHGILIAFTDDDCLPDKKWLESILNHYKNEPEIAYTGKVIVPVSEQPTDFELNTKGLETGDFVTANCVCTKATLQATGGFDEAFTEAWREDSDLEFKLLNRKVPIVKLNDAIVIHPVRKVAWGVSIKEQRKAMFNALLFKKYPDLFRKRIRKSPNWKYYFIILFFIVLAVSVFLKITLLTVVAFVGWFYLTITFIVKRLIPARKTVSHIFEMIATSVVIPFLSVFWTLYGAIKYRVLFF
ncbi:glycosyltransferase [Segetibacter koreensis]|uniref:glycosyltransferase n=1 Tax=Segetibacter koreensis TaxID=398037 RepID=UPI00036E1FE8|nr:glycosyltransferase [Segetibacter koreensis]